MTALLSAAAFATIGVDADAAAALVARGAAVLDTRGAVAYAGGHVDGAVPVDWRIGVVGGLRSGALGPADEVAAAFAALGVDDARPVLVVGAWTDGWGEEARIAWDLAYLGHADVHVLLGGMAAWTGPTVAGLAPTPVPGRFTARPDARLRATAAGIEAGDFRVLDVREPDEYAGATHFFEDWGGRIPGAANLPWRAVPGVAGGLPSDRPVATYCTGGVRAAFAWMFLVDAGIPAANYDGSWWEWSRTHPAPAPP